MIHTAQSLFARYARPELHGRTLADLSIAAHRAKLAEAGVVLCDVNAARPAARMQPKPGGLNRFPGGRRSDREWAAAVAHLLADDDVDTALARLRSASAA